MGRERTFPLCVGEMGGCGGGGSGATGFGYKEVGWWLLCGLLSNVKCTVMWLYQVLKLILGSSQVVDVI